MKSKLIAPRTLARLSEAERFFYLHAGWSHGPNETSEEGRERCARELARAESWAKSELEFAWDVDDCDSSEFTDEKPSWKLYYCVAKGAFGVTVGSLGGIDFGRRGNPWGDPYKRVVEAELALEAMPRHG